MSTTTDPTPTTATHQTPTDVQTPADANRVTESARPGAARRWTDSPVLVGVAALAAGGLVAVTVAAAVVVLTRPTPPAPTAAPAVATVEGPSTGDARQGLTADAATRRLGGTSPFYVPDSADSADRRAALANAGLTAWDSADSHDARARLVALLAHDSADSADRRAATVGSATPNSPDSADSATRRSASATSPSTGDARTGLTADSATRR